MSSMVDFAGKRSVLFFWATWHEPSAPGGQMDQIVTALKKRHPSVHFFSVEAEANHILSTSYAIEVVPTFIFLLEDGTIMNRVEGANPPEVARCSDLLATDTQSESLSASLVPLDTKLQQLVTSSPVMVFMKGTADAPKCKFSRELVELLQEDGISFGTFDILLDEEVRQGLKRFSDWPTYPQVYCKGSLVGGLDIVKSLREDGSLKNELEVAAEEVPRHSSVSVPSETSSDQLEARLKALVSSAPILLFIKGTPSEPRCGFSRKVVGLFQDEGIPFDFFDILQDEEVRQGLKKFSSWPTYPQVYSKGELIGGLDIVEELAGSGSLKQELNLDANGNTTPASS